MTMPTQKLLVSRSYFQGEFFIILTSVALLSLVTSRECYSRKDQDIVAPFDYYSNMFTHVFMVQLKFAWFEEKQN